MLNFQTFKIITSLIISSENGVVSLNENGNVRIIFGVRTGNFSIFIFYLRQIIKRKIGVAHR